MVNLNSHLAGAAPLQQTPLNDQDQRDRTPPPIAPRPPRWQRVLVGSLCLTSKDDNIAKSLAARGIKLVNPDGNRDVYGV